MDSSVCDTTYNNTTMGESRHEINDKSIANYSCMEDILEEIGPEEDQDDDEA